jgi:predicted nucleic acid-binding protein
MVGSPGSPVFVDASGWIAGANRRDTYHDAARPILDACFADGVHLITTNWTAYEAISIVKSRAGLEGAEKLWSLLQNPQAVEFVRVTEEIEAAALDLFFRYRDKNWGVVDCASLVVMERLGCRQALAYDHHFVEESHQRGFQTLV